MANIEIDCDECGVHKEGAHSESVKTICIGCFNRIAKENNRLKKLLKKQEGGQASSHS